MSAPIGPALVEPRPNLVEDSDALNHGSVGVLRRPESFSVGLNVKKKTEKRDKSVRTRISERIGRKKR